MTKSFFTIIPPAEGDASIERVRLIVRPDEDIARIEFEIAVL